MQKIKEWTDGNMGKVLVSLLIVMIIGLFNFYVKSEQFHARSEEKLQIMENDILLIQSKVRLLEIEQADKVDRATLDACLKQIDDKLDENNKYLIDIYQKLR